MGFVKKSTTIDWNNIKLRRHCSHRLESSSVKYLMALFCLKCASGEKQKLHFSGHLVFTLHPPSFSVKDTLRLSVNTQNRGDRLGGRDGGNNGAEPLKSWNVGYDSKDAGDERSVQLSLI